jgi:WD40 repeat protein
MSSTIAICGNNGGDVRFFNLGTLSCVHTIHGSEYSHPLSHVNTVTVKHDVLGVCGNSWIRLHSLEKVEAQGTVFEGGHNHNITSLSFETDGKWFVTTGEDGRLRLWDHRAHGFQSGLEHGVPINSGAIHPNRGIVVFGDRDGFINFLDLSANRVSRANISQSTNGLGVTTVAYDAYNRLVACFDNNCVKVFGDLENRTNLNESSDSTYDLDSSDDRSPRHALMPPAMIPLISRSVSNSRTIKAAASVKHVVGLVDPPPSIHHFGSDVHRELITHLSVTGLQSPRHPAIAASGSDGSFSVWRTSHDDTLYSLEARFCTTTGNAWCWRSIFVDENTRFVLSAYSDGRCMLWDTMRPCNSPAGSFDAGNGKAVRATTVMNPEFILGKNKRYR